MKKLFLERIATGLKRQSITSPSKWALNYRIMPGGPWSFRKHPWLHGMHDSRADLNIGKKAAQMGYTETVLNITFYHIDVLGYDCLYVLPNRTPDASDFSASRFDPALELSPHLNKLFSNVKNVGHKRAGSANLFVRGSQSRAGLKSIPVSFIVLDEVEEFNKESVALAMERVSGHETNQVWMVSTPSLEDFGIDKYFKRTSQEHFFFPCPACHRRIELKWPESIVITAEGLGDPRAAETYLKCYECNATLNHQDKPTFLARGEWVPQVPNVYERGFYINQLYSSAVSPYKFALKYLEGLTNPADEQEFFNSKVGIIHAVKGARVLDTDFEACIGNHEIGPQKGIITLGVDVGAFLHWEVDQWFLANSTPRTGDINMEAKCKVLDFGKAVEFEELDGIMRRFGVNFCVIDAQPERRKAKEFAERFYGRVKFCFYGRGITGKQINIASDEPMITVDRTSWLDLSLSRFRNGSIRLPRTVDLEYRNNIQALVRRYKKDKNGNPIASYEAGDKPDHYAHARNYSEIALPFALSMARNYNLSGIL